MLFSHTAFDKAALQFHSADFYKYFNSKYIVNMKKIYALCILLAAFFFFCQRPSFQQFKSKQNRHQPTSLG